jgi:DNA-binding CsgD family transcriptional regulator
MRTTEREREVLSLFCYKADEIADILKLSPYTVKTHTQHILKKFDSPSKIMCLIKAIQMGEISAFDIKTTYVDIGFWDITGTYRIDMQELIK